jgi:hypothetical protein
MDRDNAADAFKTAEEPEALFVAFQTAQQIDVGEHRDARRAM